MIAACAMQCLNAHRVRIICMQCPYAMPLMPYGRPAGLLQKRIQAKISGDRSGQRFITGRNKHALPSVCAGLLALSSLASCSDWTRPESVEIHAPTLEEQDPELYAQYLQNLREYKSSDHKMVMAVIENQKGAAPTSQGYRPSAYPDSIDFICLADAENLHPQYLDEITVTQRKGTKVLYRIDYADIRSEWEILHPETPAENAETAEDRNDADTPDTGNEDFFNYCRQRTESLAGLCGQYGFDGIVMAYGGDAPANLNDEDMAILTGGMNAFNTVMKAWKDANPGKLLLFSGLPQNLPETGILADCTYIIVNAETAVSKDELSVMIRKACVEGVPADRFIVGVAAAAPGNALSDEGWFTADADGNSVRAIEGAADWVMTADSFKKCGISVSDAHNDYFSSDAAVFPNIRKAITRMNHIGR